MSTGSDGAVTVSFGDASSPLVSGTTVTWPQTLTTAAGGQLGSLLNMSLQHAARSASTSPRSTASPTR